MTIDTDNYIPVKIDPMGTERLNARKVLQLQREGRIKTVDLRGMTQIRTNRYTIKFRKE